MKNGSEIPASHILQLPNPDLPCAMIKPLKPQTSSKRNGRSEENSQSGGYTASIRSTSSVLARLHDVSAGLHSTTGMKYGRQPHSSAEPDVAQSLSRLGSLEAHDLGIGLGQTPIRVVIRDLAEWAESDESTTASPVLTPSSSTTSFRSFCEDTPNEFKSAVDFGAPTLEVSSIRDKTVPVMSQNIVQDGSVVDSIEDDTATTPWRADTLKESNDITDANRQADNLKMECPLKRRRQNMGRQALYWSADEEIRIARSRFGRYGKKCRMRQTDAPRATHDLPPVVVQSAPDVCKIQIGLKETSPEPKEKMTWWSWLTSSITQICPARIDSVGI